MLIMRRSFALCRKQPIHTASLFSGKAIFLKPRLKYLDYDDYGSYYKKCFWALWAIGTPEAIAVIREFMTSEDAAAKEQALYRLSKIATEGPDFPTSN